MGPGLNFESQDEIQRIQTDPDASRSEYDPGADPTAPEPSKKRKSREVTTSMVWKHFKKGPRQGDGTFKAICNYCGHVYMQGNSRSTSSLLHHINKCCKKIPPTCRRKPDALQRLLQIADGEAKPSAWVFDPTRSRNNLARMVIAHEYPFNCANHHFLKVFVNDLQPCFKMPSRTTIRSDCIHVYEEKKFKLYDILGKLDCKFSFTSDLWSNKSRDRGFMSLTCHYIDDTWVLRKRIINFTPLPSPHTGHHISQAIYDKLVLWNMDKKILCLVLDNASANDAAIKEMLSIPQLRNELATDGSIFHQRCGCHILNLIVQDGLSVLSGEIHNIRETMKYIRHSQQRMEKFKLAASQVN